MAASSSRSVPRASRLMTSVISSRASSSSTVKAMTGNVNAQSVAKYSGSVGVGAPLRPRARIEPGAADTGGFQREQGLARRDAGSAVDHDVLPGAGADRLE